MGRETHYLILINIWMNEKGRQNERKMLNDAYVANTEGTENTFTTDKWMGN